jgi:hypothetical protein
MSSDVQELLTRWEFDPGQVNTFSPLRADESDHHQY